MALGQKIRSRTHRRRVVRVAMVVVVVGGSRNSRSGSATS